MNYLEFTYAKLAAARSEVQSAAKNLSKPAGTTKELWNKIYSKNVASTQKTSESAPVKDNSGEGAELDKKVGNTGETEK